MARHIKTIVKGALSVISDMLWPKLLDREHGEWRGILLLIRSICSNDRTW